MKLFGLEIRKAKKEEKRNVDNLYPIFSEALTFGGLSGKYGNMNLSAVYRAVELISDSIAVLPIKIRETDKNHSEETTQHPLYYFFNDKTENPISKYNLMKLLVQSVILKGNGFAHIKRDATGEPIGIRFLKSEDVTINYNDVTNDVTYTCAKIGSKKILPKDMIHLIKNTYNGVQGVSVLSYASRTLNLANSTENAANSFYTNGCNLSGILKVQGQLTDKQRTDIRNSWNIAYSEGGSGLAILQGNMDYTPVQLSAEDSQLLSSREYNVVDIARYFGISPVLLGDLTHSSYSTLEAAQQEFLTHTLQPYITMIESEFNRKLINNERYFINLDESYLLKTDKTAQASYYSTLLSNGVLCINEVRKELGLSPIEGGENHIIAYTKLDDNIINSKNDEVEGN